MRLSKLLITFFILFSSVTATAKSSLTDETLPWPFFSKGNCPMLWDGVFRRWEATENKKRIYFDVALVSEILGGRLIEVTKLDSEGKAISYGRGYVSEGQNFISVIMLRVDRDATKGEHGSWIVIAASSKHSSKANQLLTPEYKELMCSPENVVLMLKTKQLSFRGATSRILHRLNPK